MSNLNHLENIYRFYWESLSKAQINKLERIRDSRILIYSFLTSVALYYLYAVQFSVFGKENFYAEISFFIIWALSFVTPYLYASFFILKNKSLSEKVSFFKMFFNYSFDSVFTLHMEEYPDLIEFINMLHNAVPSLEDSDRIQKAFQIMIENRCDQGQLKMGYINSKLVSYEEFSKYRSSQKPTIKRKENFKLNQDAVNVMNQFQKEEIDQFVLTNFNRKEKSFKGYYLEHLNFNGQQDIGFFWFSLILPFSNTWSLDSIKTILNSCRLQVGYKNYKKDGLSIITKDSNLIEKDLILFFMNKEKIKNAFGNYKEESFKKIFVKNHSRDDLIKSLFFLIRLDSVVLPVVRSWYEIHHFLDNYSKIYKVPKNNDLLEEIHGQFKYSYVKSYVELGDMAYFLQNCLIARHEKIMSNISHIIKVTKNGKIYAAVEVSNGRLIEIAGYKNEKLAEHAEIIDLLKKINIINR